MKLFSKTHPAPAAPLSETDRRLALIEIERAQVARTRQSPAWR
jgi:hypothetical protein